MEFLLDTNVISEPLRVSPDPDVMASLRQHRGEIGIPAPVWHELLFGCRRLPRSRKRSTIEAYLETVVEPTMPILPYDEIAAEWHAGERARLDKQGRPTSFVDGQIAAIAVAANMTLVTRNVADFQVYRELTFECWHQA